MHTIKSCRRSNSEEKRQRTKGKERKRMSVEYRREGEKENEGVIKYPTADVKSDRKMHQVPCS